MKFPIPARVLILATILLAGCASIERQAANLDAELADITREWPGHYRGQAILPGMDGDATSVLHEISSIYAPRFGERVYFYQLRGDAIDGPVLQQKIFVFDTDPQRDQNSMRAWVAAPGQIDPDFAARPNAWRRLRPAKLMSFPAACAFRWRRIKGVFRGMVAAQDCEFDSRAFGQPVRPEMSYEISAAALIWNETLSGADGRVLASTGGPLRAERIGPVIDVRRSVYDIQGTTVKEIRRDLNAGSPLFDDGTRRAAHTDWTITWDVDSIESDSGCRVDHVATTVTIDDRVPRLLNRGAVPVDVLAEWDAYVDAVLAHELRHQQFAVNAAYRIESALPGLQEHGSCEDLLSDAARLAGELVDSDRRRERQYDDTTRYGYVEGVEFPRPTDW